MVAVIVIVRIAYSKIQRRSNKSQSQKSFSGQEGREVGHGRTEGPAAQHMYCGFNTISVIGPNLRAHIWAIYSDCISTITRRIAYSYRSAWWFRSALAYGCIGAMQLVETGTPAERSARVSCARADRCPLPRVSQRVTWQPNQIYANNIYSIRRFLSF